MTSGMFCNGAKIAEARCFVHVPRSFGVAQLSEMRFKGVSDTKAIFQKQRDVKMENLRSIIFLALCPLVLLSGISEFICLDLNDPECNVMSIEGVSLTGLSRSEVPHSAFTTSLFTGARNLSCFASTMEILWSTVQWMHSFRRSHVCPNFAERLLGLRGNQDTPTVKTWTLILFWPGCVTRC